MSWNAFHQGHTYKRKKKKETVFRFHKMKLSGKAIQKKLDKEFGGKGRESKWFDWSYLK